MDVPEIDVAELAERRAAGAVLFDVREPHEYVAGHVPGAMLVPLGEVPQRIGEFPTAGEVLLICHVGGRSYRAAEYLRGQGVAAVNVAGGTQAWADAGELLTAGEHPG